MTPDRDTIFIQPDPIDDAQVADIKSEYPAGLRSECMADFIGIRTLPPRSKGTLLRGLNKPLHSALPVATAGAIAAMEAGLGG